MKKKDTMLVDFQEFFYILETDFSETGSLLKKIIKLIRNLFLFLISICVIPLTHLVTFVFPFLRNSPQFTIKERMDNFQDFFDK